MWTEAAVACLGAVYVFTWRQQEINELNSSDDILCKQTSLWSLYGVPSNHVRFS
jgi:hypothetical protein